MLLVRREVLVRRVQLAYPEVLVRRVFQGHPVRQERQELLDHQVE